MVQKRIGLLHLIVVIFWGLSCNQDQNIAKIAHQVINFPKIIDSSIKNGQKNISQKPNIILKFSESMDTISVAKNLSLEEEGQKRINLAFNWSEDDKVCSLSLQDPSLYLSENKIHVLQILNEASSKKGFLMKQNFQLYFYAGAIDIKPPTVVSTFPDSEEKEVSGSVQIIVRFSEAMDTTSVEKAFTVTYKNGHNIEGKMQWFGNNLVFTPQNNLLAFAEIQIKLNNNCFDISKNRLEKPFQSSFTVKGKYIFNKIISGDKLPKDPYFFIPSDICLLNNSQGNYLFIADINNHRIIKAKINKIQGQSMESLIFIQTFGSNGTNEGQFYFPEGVALDTSGNIYVADYGNHRVQKFDIDGKYILQWGKKGTGDGEFQNPEGIAIDNSGDIYVVDSRNNRIQKFDKEGKYILQWGKDGTGDGEFKFPARIAIDKYGDIYVADPWNNRVQKFDKEGKYILQWGKDGTKNGEFKFPQGIAIGKSGDIYVVEYGNHRVQKFDKEGNYILQWGKEGTENGQFDNNDEHFIQQWGRKGNGGEEYICPYSIAINNSSDIYVADCYNRILKFDKEGNYILQWGKYGTENGQFDDPRGIAIGKSGDIYVTDYGNHRVQKFDKKGNYILQWGKEGTGDGEFKKPEGIAIDEAGDIYVTDVENNRIQKFDKKGTFLLQWGKEGTGDGEFKTPVRIAIDEAGDIYVVDACNKRIQKFDKMGKYILQWGKDGTGDGEFKFPQGIAIDNFGFIYVVDAWNGIQKFDKKGNYIMQWGKKGKIDGEFGNPLGIAVDKSGNIYVADGVKSRIAIIAAVSE